MVNIMGADKTSRTTQDPLRAHASLLKRSFWSALLLLHVFPYVSAFTFDGWDKSLGNAADALVRLSALSGSLVFFALKIADVSWLRLRPGAGSWIAATMVVALMHVNAVERVLLDKESGSSVMLVSLLAAGGVADPRVLRSAMVRALHERSTRRVVFTALPVSSFWFGWRESAWSLLDRLLFALRIPRAPPVQIPTSVVA